MRPRMSGGVGGVRRETAAPYPDWQPQLPRAGRLAALARRFCARELVAARRAWCGRIEGECSVEVWTRRRRVSSLQQGLGVCELSVGQCRRSRDARLG